MKKIKLWLLILVSMFCISACGSSAGSIKPGVRVSDSGINNNFHSESQEANSQIDGMENIVDEQDTGSEADQPVNRKLVRTIDFTITAKDNSGIKEIASNLMSKASSLGGYVAKHQYTQGEYSDVETLLVKVPEDQADVFMKAAQSENGEISNLNDNVDDISLRYSDTEAKIKTLETEQSRLESYLEKADNVADLKQLEDSLQDVTEKLESAKSEMMILENQVSYTSISVKIMSEKSQESEKTSALKEAFKQFKENFTNSLAFLVVMLSFLLPYVIIALIIILIIRVLQKKKSKTCKSDQSNIPNKPNNLVWPQPDTRSVQHHTAENKDTPAVNRPNNISETEKIPAETLKK